MKIIYKHSERLFEKIVSIAISILSNSITFIIAFATVLFWLSNKQFATQGIHDSIGDVILGVTFLSLFVIQKSFNRFSSSIHLKMNELVKSHESASNAVINSENKTELEMSELSKEYTELAEQLKDEEDKTS